VLPSGCKRQCYGSQLLIVHPVEIASKHEEDPGMCEKCDWSMPKQSGRTDDKRTKVKVVVFWPSAIYRLFAHDW